jgi:hypothetical protein
MNYDPENNADADRMIPPFDPDALSWEDQEALFGDENPDDYLMPEDLWDELSEFASLFSDEESEDGA